MELRKLTRRRSLNTAAEDRPSMTPLASAAAAERKTKRYTWAFNPPKNQNNAEPEDSGLHLSTCEARPVAPARSSSSASLRAGPLTLSDFNPDSTIRPRSAGSALGSRVGATKSLSQRSGTLAPIMEKRHVEISSILQPRDSTPKVKRWDAKTKITSVWDGLRRDSELFSARGNCSIHFYEKGQSRRGPSLKIPLERIYASRFASLFVLVHTEFGRGDLQYHHMHRQCDLYIPAPDDSRRGDAFTWHITTRNFFAFIIGRPLVGVSLSQSMIDLRERLNIFRPNDARNQHDMMAYLQNLGYLNFAHCPDYALAMLNFAEHYRIRDLWVDAFVHCVGMHDMLRTTEEFQFVSYGAKLLINKAAQEMRLHIGRVTCAVGNFLEEEFSPSKFGVSSGARAHLDRFRSFLYEYYVEKFGYWPPPEHAQFCKSLYKSMYFDFRALYDYLVDLESTNSLALQKPASGGICVWQHVKAFDERHGYTPLPHPHPLLPQESALHQKSSSAQASFMRTFSLSSKSDAVADLAWARDSLAAATNQIDVSHKAAPIVAAYQRFERDHSRKQDEKVSIADARKLRWLLIYGVLQMLISVIRAPKEVRITETSYPLCCLVAEYPPWQTAAKLSTDRKHSVTVPLKLDQSRIDTNSELLLQRDTGANDNTSTTSASPRKAQSVQPDDQVSATVSKTDVSPKSSRRSSIFRQTSIRSVKNLSTSISSIKSYRATSKRRGAGQASAQELPPVSPTRGSNTVVGKPSPNFCEIMVRGYGNGLNEHVGSEFLRALPMELTEESLPEIVVRPQSSPTRAELPRHRESQALANPNSGGIDSTTQDVVADPSSVNAVKLSSSASERSRTPLMDRYNQVLPGLEEQNDSFSTQSSSSGVPPPQAWESSRSNSPQSSVSSQTSPNAVHGDSKDTSTPDGLSPVSLTTSESSFSTQTLPQVFPSFGSNALTSRKSMDLPMVVEIEEMSVYQPTGIPPVGGPKIADEGDDDEEEFPDRDASKRWSVAYKTRAPIVSVPVSLKSTLRRTRTIASQTTKRRSVRF
ncbi:uncharacterized protein PV09_06141 [Verruconis gallopava]|uniref:DUF8004 domain-containing protein n=1 Tax=Verruconis gallopava TaxID=253628 RepID=A0A0D2A7H2_9PEZI|nr:uncharacterized protein PV09_06141 [Verruconis gallopava]KIW02703.1 hypothetical protein PV09_06141 [Verruconis gallopava]